MQAIDVENGAAVWEEFFKLAKPHYIRDIRSHALKIVLKFIQSSAHPTYVIPDCAVELMQSQIEFKLNLRKYMEDQKYDKKERARRNKLI